MTENFLSCDWGTSSFRLRLVNVRDCSVIAETIDGRGIAAVYNEWKQSGWDENKRINFYKNILLAEIEKLGNSYLKNLPIIISGMASSSIGIIEIPYSTIPFNINNINLNVHKILPDEKFRHEILIVSGIRTKADVMRGEETILLGCEMSKDEELFILPGTHSKHIFVQQNVVKDLKTYMTGELFDLLANKSILSVSVEKGKISKGKHPAFIKGVHESGSSNFLNNVFHVRANQLFGKLNKEENYQYLSGLLIGEELKDMHGKSFSSVTVVSSGVLSTLYEEALLAIGGKYEIKKQHADKALIKGQLFILNHYQ